MLISSSFQERSYEPHYPLSSKSNNSFQEAASLLSNIFTFNALKKEEITEIKLKVASLKDSKQTVSSRLIQKYIMELDCKDDVEMERFNRNQLKKDMLQIYENVLAGAIRTKNKDLIKKATAEYACTASEIMNIFNE